MNSLQSTSALNDLSANSAAEGEARAPSFLYAGTLDSDGSRHTWLLAVAGLLAATAMASQLLRGPQMDTRSWSMLFFRSAEYIVLSAAAGAVGLRIQWLFLPEKPSVGPVLLIRNMSAAWVFIPCIALLYRRQSLLMFSVAALAAAVLAFSLRSLFPAALESGDLADRQTRDLPSLYGLPPADSHLSRAVWIAVCAQASMLLVVQGALFFAVTLFAVSLYLLAWRWSAANSGAARWWIGSRPPFAHAGLAILLTALMMAPSAGSGWHGVFGLNFPSSKPPPVARQPSESESPASGYVGIVLWPPPTKKEIVPPAPHPSLLQARSASRPVVIPFDGPYWYFKAPNTRPSARAHIAHGKPTDVNVRSTDFGPLMMEAHQNLGTPIDLACCGEIDVAITNADNRSGEIALAMLLTDSSAPGKPSLQLGVKTIASSEPAEIPIARPPVQENLRFPIPRSRTLRRFDQIAIVFLPSRQRSRAGARIAIDSFELIPKR